MKEEELDVLFDFLSQELGLEKREDEFGLEDAIKKWSVPSSTARDRLDRLTRQGLLTTRKLNSNKRVWRKTDGTEHR